MSFLSVCGSQRDKAKIVAYRSGNASQTAQESSREIILTRLLDVFLWVFLVTILRPLTSARNYATIADRKRQIRKVILIGRSTRRNHGQKIIRTPKKSSYYSHMAQMARFELALQLSRTTPLAGEPLEPLGYICSMRTRRGEAPCNAKII